MTILKAPHSLLDMGLFVPELDKQVKFYKDFGLFVKPSAFGYEVFTHAENHKAISLQKGKKKELQFIRLAAYPDDMEGIRQQILNFGAEIVKAPENVDPQGLWTKDPDGNVINIVAEEEHRNNDGRNPGPLILKAGPHASPAPRDIKVTPLRLGHIFMLAKNYSQMVDFYVKAIGFRTSDTTEGVVIFMHLPHGSDHHVIAFAKSTHRCFHHASFEVKTVDEVGVGGQNMIQKGYTEGWGVGRHYAGSNFFYYVRDPWGSYAEYYCDIDFVPKDQQWNPRQVDPQYGLHAWGPLVPSYFLDNTEEEK